MEEVKKEVQEDEVSKIENENKRMEEALKKKEELLTKYKEVEARNKLGGKSEAGLPQKSDEEIQQEKNDASADRIYGAVYDIKKRRR